jgi:hypothetical protein
MDVAIGEAAGMVLAHGGGAAWAAVKGALLWGALGLIVAALIYQILRRAGLLDVPGGRRWPRLALALILALMVAPAFVAAGVLTGLRDAASSSVRDELARTAVPEAVGAVLVAPIVIADVGRREGIPAAAEIDLEELLERDVSFLLDQDLRRASAASIAALSGGFFADLRGEIDSRVARWLVGYAERRVSEGLAQEIDPYLALFSPLDADAPGRLSFRSASRQVGQRFADREALPRLASPFDATRFSILVAAFAAVLLLLIAIRFARRRGVSRAAS